MRRRYQAFPRSTPCLGLLAVSMACGRATLPFRNVEISRVGPMAVPQMAMPPRSGTTGMTT